MKNWVATYIDIWVTTWDYSVSDNLVLFPPLSDFYPISTICFCSPSDPLKDDDEMDKTIIASRHWIFNGLHWDIKKNYNENSEIIYCIPFAFTLLLSLMNPPQMNRAKNEDSGAFIHIVYSILLLFILSLLHSFESHKNKISPDTETIHPKHQARKRWKG